MHRRFWRLTLLLALTATTIATTVQPEAVHAAGINDKAAHAATFLLLAFLSHRAFPETATLWKAAPLFTYGLLIECIQYYIPFREFSLLDQMANTVGILLFFLWTGMWSAGREKAGQEDAVTAEDAEKRGENH
jgi:VanZ family protein